MEEIHTTYNPANVSIHHSATPNSLNLDRNLRVLVAEDDPTNRIVAERYLNKMGFDVDLVTNGMEALNKLEKENYDLILMDCQMPVMDGYQATKEIRHREGLLNHTPIIALTANAVNGDAEKCFAAGMDAYIPKPVKMKSLKEVINQTLDQLSQNTEETENDFSRENRGIN
jgi:CheY-like chemotaxis protein